MKKYLTAAALLGVIGFAGISLANPQGYYGYGCDGPTYCDNWSYSEKDDAKASAFFEETKEIRREIVVKRSELEALMLQDNPDEKKVAALTGELYDLRTKMHEKAGETFEGRAGNGYGQGYGNCGRGRRGW